MCESKKREISINWFFCKNILSKCGPGGLDGDGVIYLRAMAKMTWWLYTIPFVSAFIYWLAIRMSLKLLFHPCRPRRVLGFRLQGVFPKKQRQMAESLGRMAAQHLFSSGDIGKTVADPENVKRILPLVEQHIDNFLRNKLKEAMPMISMFIGEKTIVQLKGIFLAELEELFPVVMRSYVSQLREDPDLGRIVAEKIADIPNDRLEAMLRSFLSGEIRFAELAGAGLGFLIGSLQILITLMMK